MRAYGPVMQGFKPCGPEHDNGDGSISVPLLNGQWLCVNPNGGFEERPTPGGAWESFFKGNNCIIAERDGGARGLLVYVIPVVG